MYKTLQIPSVIALYSAYALDLATTFRFLLLQAIRLPLINVQQPMVDL